MKHFPIFLALEGCRVVLSGGGDAALAKLRLLMKTRARLTVHAPAPAPEIVDWARGGAREADLVLHDRDISPRILDLARHEAVFGALPGSASPLIDVAGAGRHVICQMSAAPDAQMLASCRSAGIAALVIPGITPSPNLTPLQEIA